MVLVWWNKIWPLLSVFIIQSVLTRSKPRQSLHDVLHTTVDDQCRMSLLTSYTSLGLPLLLLSSFINVFKDMLYNKARHHLVGTDIQFYVCHTDKKWTNNVFLRKAAKKKNKKCLKTQFQIGYLLNCLLCVDTAILHPLCSVSFYPWLGLSGVKKPKRLRRSLI